MIVGKEGLPNMPLESMREVIAEFQAAWHFGEDSGARLQEYLEMRQRYDGAIRTMRARLEVLDGEFTLFDARNPIHHIESRLKTPMSILSKLRNKGFDLTLAAARAHLSDIAGIRVICNYAQDVYCIEQALRSQSDIRLIRRSDYIRHPKSNGYRSLHLILGIPVFLSDHTEEVPIEVQLRTIAMDCWASLEHELRYKDEDNVPEGLSQRLKRCADISAQLDAEMQGIYLEIMADHTSPVGPPDHEERTDAYHPNSLL